MRLAYYEHFWLYDKFFELSPTGTTEFASIRDVFKSPVSRIMLHDEGAGTSSVIRDEGKQSMADNANIEEHST